MFFYYNNIFFIILSRSSGRGDRDEHGKYGNPIFVFSYVGRLKPYRASASLSLYSPVSGSAHPSSDDAFQCMTIIALPRP